MKYTDAQIYDAMHKAADHIERNPGDYNFFNTFVPECGTPGCLLGWVGLFLGRKSGSNLEALEVVGLEGMDFYDLVDEFTGELWLVKADLAAQGLRGYAEKYHKPVEPC